MKSIFLFVVIMCVGTALAVFIPIISHSGANLVVLMVAGFVFLIMSIVFGVIWRTLSRVGVFGDPGSIQALMRQGKVRGRGRFVVGGVAFGADGADGDGADGDMFDAGGVDAGDFDPNHIHDHSHLHDHASAHESSHYTDTSSNFDSSSTTDFSSSTSDFSSSSSNNDW